LRQTQRSPEGAPAGPPGVEVVAAAAVSMAFVVGRLQRYTRSGFRQRPTEQLDSCLRHLLLNL